MAVVIMTPAAVADLARLTTTHALPARTRARVKASLRLLAAFPLLGTRLRDRWHGFRFVLGPWPWMLLVYFYDEPSNQVWIVTIQDSRSAGSATSPGVTGRHGGTAERKPRLNETHAAYLLTPLATDAAATPLDDPWLPQIVHRIVRAVSPARIVLFGSRARGEAHPGSDYDLLVVVDNSVDRRATRISVRRSFEDLPVAADVVVATTEEVAGHQGRPRGVLHWALVEGRVVHERA